jgi:hypothetical protein
LLNCCSFLDSSHHLLLLLLLLLDLSRLLPAAGPVPAGDVVLPPSSSFGRHFSHLQSSTTHTAATQANPTSNTLSTGQGKLIDPGKQRQAYQTGQKP